MPRKSTYKTKHMDELLAYMKEMKGQHVTVNDVSVHFANAGTAIGTTTLYRNLERLVEQGVVAKYVIDGTSSACFEYVGRDEKEQETCYHCKCEKCGKVIHLACDEVACLGNHIMEHHGFAIDYHRTVFYGLCAECREEEAPKMFGHMK